MAIREVVLHAFYRRVKQGDMEVGQVPVPYQAPLQGLMDITEKTGEEENIKEEH